MRDIDAPTRRSVIGLITTLKHGDMYRANYYPKPEYNIMGLFN